MSLLSLAANPQPGRAMAVLTLQCRRSGWEYLIEIFKLKF